MYEVQSDGTLRWRAGSAVTPVPRANTRVQTQSAGTGYFGAVSCLAAAPRRWAHLTCIRRKSGDTICGRFSSRPCAPQGVW